MMIMITITKAYDADVAMGAETDTQDAAGAVVAEAQDKYAQSTY